MSIPATRRSWRPSKIRVRLTSLYATALLLAGAVLIALMLLYLRHALDGQLATRIGDTDRDHVLRAMLVASLVSLGAVGVLATGFGWLMAGRALRPLQQITATARRVADRSLHERIALDGPDDEIKDLADTFDAMLERLDRSFDSQRRFVANASHELRTPLTLNRTLIEVTLDDPQAPPAVRQLGVTLLAVNQRHERLIDGLLTLASSEQTVAQPANVDLADIAGHIIAQVRDAAQQAGIAIHSELRPAPVTGDPILLERLTHNLIDNAIRYNLPEHGQLTVTTGMADADLIDARAQLVVANTGPVVPGYEIPALFEPFRRLPATDRVADPTPATSRGAGLGMSIVQAVARAHGGEVHASPHAGGGLTVKVHLPAGRAPDPWSAAEGDGPALPGRR